MINQTYHKASLSIISDNKTIAEAFNSCFANIGKKTSQGVPKSNKHFSEYLHNPNISSMYIETVEYNEVISIVNKMKSKTSSGHDSISTKLIEQSINNIIEPLTIIINTSLSTGIIPNQLKIAKVIPIHKQSDKKTSQQ